ncbi:MAG: energy transducer TonB [Acidobacteria bacterium]|nr:energy transducer TonB [Acidobacteriota bacterium]MCA1641836.1 energy transducer TonB [Acidobacteriota bacterium]
MFHNLIESGSHRRDLARRGRFFLGTLASYALVAAAVAVTGVYAYSARLDEQNYQITILPTWAVPQPAAQPVERERAPASHAAGTTNEVFERTHAYTSLNTATPNPPPVSTEPSNAPPLPPGVDYIISGRNRNPGGVTGPTGPGGNATPLAGNVRPHVVETEELRAPEPPTPTPAPTPRAPVVISSILGSKIVSKPVPVYPPIAKAAGIEGSVSVEILVDEQGRVVSAKATTGHALLRIAAQQAATQARFTPTKLNGEPVKVSGVITYNFVLH